MSTYLFYSLFWVTPTRKNFFVLLSVEKTQKHSLPISR